MIPALHRKRHTQQSSIRSLCVCLDGLPERIRTFDLQSRSLTRYPAVPRVDIQPGIFPRHCCIIAQTGAECNTFLKNKRNFPRGSACVSGTRRSAPALCPGQRRGQIHSPCAGISKPWIKPLTSAEQISPPMTRFRYTSTLAYTEPCQPS